MAGNYLHIVFTVAVAFLVTYASMPFVRIIAKKIGAVDVPKDDRRMHSQPIPRLGGLGIFYGFVVSLLCFLDISGPFLGIFIGSIIIVTLGAVDDIKQLSAPVKFIIQLLAASVAAYSGLMIRFISVPEFISPSGIITMPDPVAATVSVLWIVGVTNAVNLIDGLDGLAAGVSAICALSMMFVAIINVNLPIAILAAAVVGSCFGFLPYNLNPAKMFMGDAGALFLGFVLACMSVQGLFKVYAVISFVIPFLILGLPIFDTIFAIIRRLLSGKHIMAPDRGHLHHRLMDMGFSQKQSVLILYSVSGLLGLSAIIMASSGTLKAVFLIFSVVLFVMIGTYFSDKPDAGNYERGEENE